MTLLHRLVNRLIPGGPLAQITRNQPTNTTMPHTLTIGHFYDVAALKCTGWTPGDHSGSSGYCFTDYFDDGVYLGPDDHGIEPIFTPKPEEVYFDPTDHGG